MAVIDWEERKYSSAFEVTSQLNWAMWRLEAHYQLLGTYHHGQGVEEDENLEISIMR
jgi:hypothetical protein